MTLSRQPAYHLILLSIIVIAYAQPPPATYLPSIQDPRAVYVDPTTSDVYVADYRTPAVVRFNSSGSVILNLWSPELSTSDVQSLNSVPLQMTTLLVDAAASTIYVNGGTSYLGSSVRTFSSLDGSFISTLYNSANQLAIAFDPTQPTQLLVASGANILRLNKTTGAVVATYPVSSILSQVLAMVVDAFGFMYLITTSSSVLKLNSHGALVLTFNTSNMVSPGGILIDPRQGNLYVSDQVANQVFMYNSTGLFLLSFPVAERPLGMSFDAGYNLYIAAGYLGTKTALPYLTVGTAGVYKYSNNFNVTQVFTCGVPLVSDMRMVDDQYYVMVGLDTVAKLDSRGSTMWMVQFSPYSIYQYPDLRMLCPSAQGDWLYVVDHSEGWIYQLNASSGVIVSQKIGNTDYSTSCAVWNSTVLYFVTPEVPGESASIQRTDENYNTIQLYLTIASPLADVALDAEGLYLYVTAVSSYGDYWPLYQVNTITGNYMIFPVPNGAVGVAIDVWNYLYLTYQSSNDCFSLQPDIVFQVYSNTTVSATNLNHSLVQVGGGVGCQYADRIVVSSNGRISAALTDFGSQVIAVWLPQRTQTVPSSSSSSSSTTRSTGVTRSSTATPTSSSASTSGSTTGMQSTSSTSACSTSQQTNCNNVANTWFQQWGNIIYLVATCTPVNDVLICPNSTCQQVLEAHTAYPYLQCDGIGCYPGAESGYLYSVDELLYTNSSCRSYVLPTPPSSSSSTGSKELPASRTSPPPVGNSAVTALPNQVWILHLSIVTITLFVMQLGASTCQ